MLLVEKKVEDSEFYVMQYKQFETIEMNELIELFSSLFEKEIILNSDFLSLTWIVTNEREVRKLNFSLNEIHFNRESNTTRKLGSYNRLILSLKAFILFKIDNISLSEVYEVLRMLKKFLIETSYLNEDYINTIKEKDDIKKNSSYYATLHHLLDYLNFYQEGYSEEFPELLIFQLDRYNRFKELNSKTNKREIGNLESIFKFGDAINSYWETCSTEKKEEYYPIKLWWEITTKIPLRVTEFLLTPYDCIREENNKYFLKVRRTKLKGQDGFRVSHKVDDDFEIHETRIDYELYQLIMDYKDMVDKYDLQPNFYTEDYIHVGKRRFLLSHRSYFHKLRFKGATYKGSYMLDYFSYRNLRWLLDRFFVEVILSEFNYEVISKGRKEDELKTYQLESVSLMDTRHYAFINLVLNNIEPLIIKKISGHKSIESSYHYYNHVDKFVKCYTYSMAKRLLREEKRKSGEWIIEHNNDNHEEHVYREVIKKEKITYKDVKNGKCSSPQGMDFSDCRLVEGICGRGCKFFHENKGSDITEERNNYLQENERVLKTEIEALQYLIGNYRKEKNFKEDYGQKITKIKSIATQNAYLLSKLQSEEIRHGENHKI